MTAEESSEAHTRDGAKPLERTAAELGLLVADEVRAAIDSAEQAAEELRRTALADAEADSRQIHRSASVVRERIDAVEAEVGRVLDGLRAEVTQIVEQAARELEQRPAAPDASRVTAAEPPLGAGAEPAPDLAESPLGGSKPRRRRLFGRRRRAPPPCAVCGRAAEDDDVDVDRWRLVGRVSLCPTCQADGWQVPDGARVPHRSPRGHKD